MNLRLLNNDNRIDFLSDNNEPLINTKLKNLPEEHLVLAIDGLAMICTYMNYGISTPNSRLSMGPNAK